jgi:hypothetical protein
MLESYWQPVPTILDSGIGGRAITSELTNYQKVIFEFSGKIIAFRMLSRLAAGSDRISARFECGGD